MSSSITKFWKNWSVWFGRVGGKNVKCDPQQRLFYDKSGKYHRTSTKLIIYRKVHFIRKFISVAAAYQSCHNCCGYLEKTNNLSKIIYCWWYDMMLKFIHRLHQYIFRVTLKTASRLQSQLNKLLLCFLDVQMLLTTWFNCWRKTWWIWKILFSSGQWTLGWKRAKLSFCF